MVKKRLDLLMLERGLAESRARAQALLMAGEVEVDGKIVLKPGIPVNEDVSIKVITPARFVSRGGVKLECALDVFAIDVSGKVAADIGASTGGFTDCLVQRGATKVYAVDVGYGQLDYRLRRDPRVVVMERVNARYAFEIPEKVDIITMDLSFISVDKVIPSVSGLLKEGGQIIILLKPQFEARREEVGKGGLIRDPLLHATILGRFINWVVGRGYRLKGLVASPIEGASGNREFLILLEMS